MIRIRLFLFYTVMAFISVVRPAEGTRLVDDATDYRDALRRDYAKGLLDRRTGEPRPVKPSSGPSDATVWAGLGLALLVCGSWAALLVYLAVRWFK